MGTTNVKQKMKEIKGVGENVKARKDQAFLGLPQRRAECEGFNDAVETEMTCRTAGILEWVAISSPRGSSRPRDQTHISCISCNVGRFFTAEPLGKPQLKITEAYSWSYNKSVWF